MEFISSCILAKNPRQVWEAKCEAAGPGQLCPLAGVLCVQVLCVHRTLVTVLPAASSFYLPPFLVGSVKSEDLQRGWDYCHKIGSKDSTSICSCWTGGRGGLKFTLGTRGCLLLILNFFSCYVFFICIECIFQGTLCFDSIISWFTMFKEDKNIETNWKKIPVFRTKGIKPPW